MTTTEYLGIDPGATGGVCLLRESKVLVLESMPDSKVDLLTLVGQCGGSEGTVFCYLEKVSGYIGNAHPGSTMFKFGQGYGRVEMALVASGIPFETIPPHKWQKALGVPPRAKGRAPESRQQFKGRLKSKAQELFPGVKVTLATCDALLIAEYCRRVREGEL